MYSHGKKQLENNHFQPSQSISISSALLCYVQEEALHCSTKVFRSALNASIGLTKFMNKN